MIDSKARERIINQGRDEQIVNVVQGLTQQVQMESVRTQQNFLSVLSSLYRQLAEILSVVKTFRVELPKIYRVEGEIKVSNQIEISNFPETQRIEGEVSIKNLPPLEISNFPSENRFGELLTFFKSFKLSLPKLYQVKGNVDIDSLPPVQISNFPNFDQKPELARISAGILEMRDTLVKAILAGKTVKNDPISISKPIPLEGMEDLIKGIEEVNAGIDILIKASQENTGLDPSKPMAVSIVEDKLPRPMPVTNVSINSLGGFVKTRQVTVTSALTPLPGEVLANRRNLVVYNNGAQTLEIGGSTFTFGNGMPVPAGTYSSAIDAGPNLIVYGRVASGSLDVRTLESSDIQTGR